MSSLNLHEFVAIFGAGVLASLTPCVYPLLPITLGFMGRQAGRGVKSQVLLFFAGQSFCFAGLGIAAVALGEAFGWLSTDPRINFVLGVALILAGLASWIDRIPAALQRMSDRVQSRLRFGAGASAAFLLGFGSALVASPCTTPVLSGVLLTVSQSETFGRGSLLMLDYSLGFSSLMLLLGLGLLHAGRLPRAGQWLHYLHKLSALCLLGLGVYRLYSIGRF